LICVSYVVCIGIIPDFKSNLHRNTLPLQSKETHRNTLHFRSKDSPRATPNTFIQFTDALVERLVKREQRRTRSLTISDAGGQPGGTAPPFVGAAIAGSTPLPPPPSDSGTRVRRPDVPASLPTPSSSDPRAVLTAKRPDARSSARSLGAPVRPEAICVLVAVLVVAHARIALCAPPTPLAADIVLRLVLLRHTRMISANAIRTSVLARFCRLVPSLSLIERLMERGLL
jgi:hypothetical protein